ncbi:hypothetical protein K492DRAFT_176692 [Lichtheimia hyalospora FSU 10163]|nr:hypothetical protein K492DRAFT_176692 [Lichtheimia hyalospora FSU 10163]
MQHTQRNFINGLPLELQLQVTSYLDFADLWYLGTCSRTCQSLVHQAILHKYHVNVKGMHPFDRSIHAAMAHVERHDTATRDVAHQLAGKIRDWVPLIQCRSSLDILIYKTLGIILDHVLYDNTSIDDTSNAVGHLVVNCLSALHSNLMTLFGNTTADIFHRLLLAHIIRHLDNFIKSPITTCTQRRRSFRVFIRFIGMLAQTKLMTIADLHSLAQQRIAYLKKPPTLILSDMTNVSAREQWIEEAELRTIVLFDLLRAVISRQQLHWDSGKDMSNFATLVNQTVSTLVSFKTSVNNLTATTTSSSNTTAY